jgi:hypothetical protein
MKLRDWIDSSKLNYNLLCLNKNAIELLKENPHKIDWSTLSRNSEAIELLRKNKNKNDWSQLSYNPNPYAIELLKNKVIELSLLL